MILTTGSFPRAVLELTGRDPRLADLVDRHGVPPFWHRPPGFATLVLFILEQQVSLASAKATFERMAIRLGGVTPGAVAAADPQDLRQCGLSRQKQRYVSGVAALVQNGELSLDRLEEGTDREVRQRLLSVIGIGPWTADVYLLACLRRPDVWPVGDRALQVSVAEVLGLDSPPTPDELEAIGERWRPLRSVAARLMWHDYLQRRGRSETDVGGLDGSPISDSRGSSVVG